MQSLFDVAQQCYIKILSIRVIECFFFLTFIIHTTYASSVHNTNGHLSVIYIKKILTYKLARELKKKKKKSDLKAALTYKYVTRFYYNELRRDKTHQNCRKFAEVRCIFTFIV